MWMFGSTIGQQERQRVPWQPINDHPSQQRRRWRRRCVAVVPVHSLDFPWGYVVGILIEARREKGLQFVSPHFPTCRMLWSFIIYMYIHILYVWLCTDPGGKFQAGPAGSGQSFGEGSRRSWWSIWPLTGEGSWKVRKVLCKVPVGYRSRYSLESWEGSQ